MPSTRYKWSSINQLSEQKTTSSPEGIFDVSQFKRHVNKDDVSPAVVEILQQEFGEDMAGGESNKIWTTGSRPIRSSM